jgi:5-methyltetrahydrofolate--homocysteine methyltransferase
VHVLDASRVVDVVANLVGHQREDFAAANRVQQHELREKHAARRERPLLSYRDALANRLRTDWTTSPPLVPSFIGRRVIDVPLDEIVPYIDWTFFFAAWDLKGRFPAILDHPQHGTAARELYEHAQTLLRRIIDERLLSARAVYGFWPAASDGDDIVLYADETRQREILRFNMLRQQETIADRKPNLSLADYVASTTDQVCDYIGAFAVTAGLGAEELAQGFERAHDDYHAIMVKAIADRLAEACVTYLHARARMEWGVREQISIEEIVVEHHSGIRPGFGYPACPDHSEKFKLFDLLDAEDIGMHLSEHAAMMPAASVSGLFFSHPDARYFMINRLGEDQIADYARRKGMSVSDVERWLGSVLAYEPARC